MRTISQPVKEAVDAILMGGKNIYEFTTDRPFRLQKNVYDYLRKRKQYVQTAITGDRVYFWGLTCIK